MPEHGHARAAARSARAAAALRGARPEVVRERWKAEWTWLVGGSRQVRTGGGTESRDVAATRRRLASLPSARRPDVAPPDGLAAHPRPPVGACVTSRGLPSEVIEVLGCSRLVERPVRFVAGQTLHRGHLSAYRVRGGGPHVCLRDGTADLHALGQVFGDPHAELPAARARRAAGARPARSPCSTSAPTSARGGRRSRRACRWRGWSRSSPTPGPRRCCGGPCGPTGARPTGPWSRPARRRRTATVAFRPDGFGLSRMGDGPGSVRVPARDVFTLLDGRRPPEGRHRGRRVGAAGAIRAFASCAAR